MRYPLHGLKIVIICAASLSAQSKVAFGEDTVEVRAARVCAGIGQSGWNAQGPLKLDNLSVQGDVNGTITVKRDGVDLGQIDRGSYKDFSSCLIRMTELLLSTVKQEPPPPPRPHKVVKVCMGNGGGANCLSGAGAAYDCNTYRGMGGGASQTYDVLADRFCGYYEGHIRKVDPHNIIVTQDNGGGECGWTAFEVTCN
jgi:hypothetical protein